MLSHIIAVTTVTIHVAGAQELTCTDGGTTFDCNDAQYCCGSACCNSEGFWAMYIIAGIGGIAVLALGIALLHSVLKGLFCSKSSASRSATPLPTKESVTKANIYPPSTDLYAEPNPGPGPPDETNSGHPRSPPQRKQANIVTPTMSSSYLLHVPDSADSYLPDQSQSSA